MAQESAACRRGGAGIFYESYGVFSRGGFVRPSDGPSVGPWAHGESPPVIVLKSEKNAHLRYYILSVCVSVCKEDMDGGCAPLPTRSQFGNVQYDKTDFVKFVLH